MRRICFVLIVGIVAGACSGGETAPDSTTVTTVAPTIPTTTGPTLPATTTSTTSIGVEALTNRDIAADLIGLMPLPDLPAGWGGWNLISSVLETNGDLVRIRIQDPRDAAADLVDFARQNGARSVFTPDGEGLPAVDTWVEVFDTDAGASGYLADFVRDAVKGLETGSISERRVLNSDGFDIADLDSGSIGLILREADVGSDAIVAVETLVGFRIGRILGFVSIQRAAERDDALAAERLATLLDERIRGVLNGSITIPEPPPPPPPDLSAYAWSYTETLLQTIDEFESEAEATSSGTAIPPDLVDCTVNTFLTEKRYVRDGEEAWLIDRSGSAIPIADPATGQAATDLAYCPPWPVSAPGLGIDLVDGIEEEFAGRPAVRYDLGLGHLVDMGALPDGLGLVVVETATVWIDAEEPWLLGFDMAVSGTGDDFAELLGPDSAADPEGLVRASLSYRTERINDEALAVVPPG